MRAMPHRQGPYRPFMRGLGLLGGTVLCFLAPSPSPQAAADRPAETRLWGLDILGNGPSTAVLGAGGFNTFPDHSREATVGELRLEYRHGEKWYVFGPLAGAAYSTQGAVFGYVGLYTEARPAEHWLISPAVGIGAYGQNDGKDLGGVLQFHTALDVAYRFRNDHRLGAMIAHISNANLHDSNRGTESLLLLYSIPIGR